MKKLKFLFGILLFITACFGGYSTESRFYSLQTKTDVEPVNRNKITIGVDDILLPETVDRPQIVVSKPDSTEVIISETNRWSEPLDSLIQRTLVADIAAYLPRAVVKVRELNEKFQTVIGLEIVRFEMIEGKEAVLEAWWSVLDRSGDKKYQQKFYQTQKISNSFDDFVRAESLLISSLAQNIAQKISR